MELLFFLLLLVMLGIFGYAKLQTGVFRTPSQIFSSEEEEEVVEVGYLEK